MKPQYLFTSARLGFREWQDDDIEPFAAINVDPEVMEFFPALQQLPHTMGFIQRMQAQYKDKGYCYYAVDTLEDGVFIGFIGISEQIFESDFTPCNDIGWRLKKAAWNKGYATEGAKRCLTYAFEDLKMDKISSIAPLANQRSWSVMEKIGMTRITEFLHPLLADDKRLERCVLYEMKKS